MEDLGFFGFLKEEYLGSYLGGWENTWVNGTIPYLTCATGNGVATYKILDRSSLRVVGKEAPIYKTLVEEKETIVRDCFIYIEEIDMWINLEHFTRV